MTATDFVEAALKALQRLNDHMSGPARYMVCGLCFKIPPKIDLEELREALLGASLIFVHPQNREDCVWIYF